MSEFSRINHLICTKFISPIYCFDTTWFILRNVLESFVRCTFVSCAFHWLGFSISMYTSLLSNFMDFILNFLMKGLTLFRPSSQVGPQAEWPPTESASQLNHRGGNSSCWSQAYTKTLDQLSYFCWRHWTWQCHVQRSFEPRIGEPFPNEKLLNNC